ncbi:ATPase [Erysipelothrix piscisicarius]|uniref:ATPase n=1 Tax=Erysipelothrix piscisicarius TaxID=2485784 RepID=A0A3S8RMU8_9FIRM|nr:V-type ATP synthase subunit E [Erysipelothrix piscisicarius]AZK44179.1 ATPase [Erysipelothrix piscisicarius]
MAGEKAKVSKEIVNIIDEEARNYTEMSQRAQKEKVDSELSAYKIQVEYSIKSRIRSIKDREEKKRSRVESELRFSVQKRLRMRRQELLDSFGNEIKEKVVHFRKSEDYKNYLDQCLDGLNLDPTLPVVISICREDQLLFDVKNATIEFIELELGGFLCEVGNVVYDYTLDSRFNDAMKYFVQESQLWI